MADSPFDINSGSPALIALTVLEGIQVFTGFLPPFYSIRTQAKEGDFNEVRQNTRDGVILASAFTVGLGIALSSLIKSPWPAVAAVANAVVLGSVYEFALKRAEPYGY